MKKKIKDMTPEERAEYQRDWYARKTSKVSQPLYVQINNCPDYLRDAILNAIKECK